MNQTAPSVRQLMKRAQSAMERLQGGEALALLDQVLGLNPNHAEALYNIAYILHCSGDYAKANQLYQRSIEADPNYIDSYLMLCKLFEEQNRGAEAIQIARAATQIAPNDPKTHHELVHQLVRFNHAHLATDYLEQVLPVFPKDAKLLQVYCITLKMNERHDDAERAYQKLITEHNTALSVRILYETYLPRLYRSVAEIEHARLKFKSFLEELGASKQKIKLNELNFQPLFQLAFHNRDNKELLQLYTKTLRSIVPELNYTAPHCKVNHTAHSDKIRVGFTSRHMHNHSVGNCYRNVMISIAKTPGFEVIFFKLGDVIDDKIQEIADAGIPIISMPISVETCRKTIADHKLDILIYPDIGMDSGTHYLAMARLAPYQLCFQGHPETTGIDTIDYLVSSRSYEPPHADENYTEQLLCNEGIDTIFKRPKTPEYWLTREELGLPLDKKLYVCPMSIQKFHPDFDGVLLDILQQDPNAVIVLFNDFQQASASALLQERILSQCPKDRVIFLPWMTIIEGLFSVMKVADAILDTIYFGGGTTIQYAFHFGFPVVTMPGHYARGRVVYSYYSIMGVADAPIAKDVKEYAMLAVKLANDKTYAKHISNEILSRNDALFDAQPYAPKIVQLLHDIMNQNLENYKR